jgi:haloacetate dehalogenase
MHRQVECPLLALWGEHAPMHRLYDVAATWRERATNVTGKALPGSHYLVEELSDVVADELRQFFLATAR